nr:type II toxin-antitoxin system VapC family toxin [uncultured Lichenicoccus sp.]
MRRLVIDASVAIKWVVEEPGTGAALALRRYRLSAPDLLIAECANILWKKVRRQEISPDQASLAGQLLEHAAVELIPMRRLLEPAFRLAVQMDHPAYDCIYLALAQSSGCSFVTADARFCARARSHVPPDQVLDLATALERLDAETGP